MTDDLSFKTVCFDFFAALFLFGVSSEHMVRDGFSFMGIGIYSKITTELVVEGVCLHALSGDDEVSNRGSAVMSQYFRFVDIISRCLLVFFV